MIVLAVKNEDLDFGGCGLKGGTEEQSESEAEGFHGEKRTQNRPEISGQRSKSRSRVFPSNDCITQESAGA